MEIEIKIPDGCRLIGVKTDGNIVVVVCDSIEEKPKRRKSLKPIGFASYGKPSLNKKEKCSTETTNMTKKSMTGGEH
jgi:hypothetical protein